MAFLQLGCQGEGCTELLTFIPTPQGYLYKKTAAAVASWKRRFFVLDSQGLLYYYSQKV